MNSESPSTNPTTATSTEPSKAINSAPEVSIEEDVVVPGSATGQARGSGISPDEVAAKLAGIPEFISVWWAEYLPWRRRFAAVFRREFSGYFRTPIAYVFLCAVLVVLQGITWSTVGNFFEREDASLEVMFNALPWVFLMLMPALGMRLWAEEKRSGTWELLFTHPVSRLQAVLAKFLAAWCFALIALALTFTMPITVSILGDPDGGALVSGYLGAALMAAAYLAICGFASALTSNQVIGFVLGLVFCLGFVLVGLDSVSALLHGLAMPVPLVDAIVNLGFIPHFEPMVKGLITLRDAVYFFAVITAGLTLTVASVRD